MADNTVFDQLGIDPTQGIDATEIAAIKATLARIKNSAARVAIDNDTSTTLAILREIETVVRQVVKSGVSSVADVRSTLAVNSTGQPAQQLTGGASPTPAASEQEQLSSEERKLLAGLRDLTKGQFAAVNKIVVGVTEVDEDGNLSEVAALKAELKKQREALQTELKDVRTEVSTLTKERDKVKQELVDVQDPKKPGSLAHQLDVEKSKAKTNTTQPPAPAPPAKDMVEKAKIATELAPLVEAAGTAKARGRSGTHVDLNRDVFVAAVKKLDDLSKK